MAPKNPFTGQTVRDLLLVCLCGTAALCACSGAIEPAAASEARYQVISLRPSARVAVRSEQDHALVEINSGDGIGGAAVRLLSGAWPPSIILRFHLRGLEGLTFAFDDSAVHVSVTTQNVIIESVSHGEEGQEAIDAGSDYWMPVTFSDAQGQPTTVVAAGGTIDVVVPPHFHNGDYDAFTVQWVDFYR